MHQWAVTLATVVLTVLLVTATGPSAAYESAQAVPALEPPETDDSGDADSRVSQPGLPKSWGHFANMPPVRSTVLDLFLSALAWPTQGTDGDHGVGTGTDESNGQNVEQGNDENSGKDEGKCEGEDKGEDFVSVTIVTIDGTTSSAGCTIEGR